MFIYTAAARTSFTAALEIIVGLGLHDATLVIS